MVWQICDNDEYARDLLGSPEIGYGAISTFHMRQNFADLLPLLHRCTLPFVALQDAHGLEPWWWADDLAGYRTVFLATEPTWDAWLMALDRNWVVAIRHDEVTRFRTRMLANGPRWVREAVRRDEAAWRWWGDKPEDIRRPLVSVVAVKPGDAFEAGAPAKGVAVRVRTAWSNNPQGVPVKQVAELVSLIVDGRPATTRRVERKGDKGKLADVYEIAELADLKDGSHKAEATVRRLDTGSESKAAVEFTVP